MSSEAITQNDLREILSRTVGSIPSEYKKLLWTNPSPTSAMSGGTTIVASGADEYDAIEVEYKTAHIYDGYETASAPFVVGAHITLFAPSGLTGEFTGQSVNAVRTISMGAGGLLMVDSAIAMYSGGTSTNNNMCIPYKVYGIKYERVAPPQVDASDYVIEQGTEGIWTYRKWDSGIAECWGTWSGSLTHYATVFGGYAYTTSVNYPTSLFVVPPVHTYSAYVGSGFALTGTVTSANSDRVNLYALSNVSGTSTVYFYISSIGRWK